MKVTKAIIVLIAIIGIPYISHSESNDEQLTDFDLKTIEYADYNSVDRVLMKMRKIYKEKGKEPLLPAVPSLIKRTLKDLRNEETFNSEIEGPGELLGNLIWAVSVTGDERTKPVLLEFMVAKKVSSWNVSRGFLNIGESVIPDIIDSLQSPNDWTKRRAAFYLGKMCEFDTTGTFFSSNDKNIIRDNLLTILDDYIDPVYIATVIFSLGYFGDVSTIPVLEHMKNNDEYSIQGRQGRSYPSRLAAQEAIERIRSR